MKGKVYAINPRLARAAIEVDDNDYTIVEISDPAELQPGESRHHR